MKKSFWAAAALACLCMPMYAQDTTKDTPPPAKKAEPEITLKIGDKAPKISVTKWMKGEPVSELKTGQPYIIEFWATWCGPCIAFMPHLSELQQEYKGKGLTIISLTSRDPNNSEEAVTEFVKNRGNIMEYTVGYSEDRATNQAYMTASGQRGIPCAFVINKEGNIAFIGHPMMLDRVLPKVMDGSWNGAEDAKKATEAMEEFFKVMGGAGADPEAGLKAFAEQEAKNPDLTKQFPEQKMMLLLRNKKLDEAEVLFTSIFEKAKKHNDSGKLSSICRLWSDPTMNPEKKKLELAIEAGLAASKLAGPKDIGSLIAVASAYHASGNIEKSTEYADKAVEAGSNEAMKKSISNFVEKFKKKD